MKFIFLIFLIFFISCAYPDIDSIPEHRKSIITEEESIDLCKMSNSDNLEVIKCLVTYYTKLHNEKKDEKLK